MRRLPLWSISIQRLDKGIAPTFEAGLIWGKVRVATLQRDWIFVKSDLENPRDPHGPYVFAAHFARSLSDLNNCLPEPISDHRPMTVVFHSTNPRNLELLRMTFNNMDISGRCAAFLKSAGRRFVSTA
jgi:hypothetical protein